MPLPKELKKELANCRGYDCECSAYYEGECCCPADWRSRDEVVMDWVRKHPQTREVVIDAYIFD